MNAIVCNVFKNSLFSLCNCWNILPSWANPDSSAWSLCLIKFQTYSLNQGRFCFFHEHVVFFLLNSFSTSLIMNSSLWEASSKFLVDNIQFHCLSWHSNSLILKLYNWSQYFHLLPHSSSPDSLWQLICSLL